MRSRPLLLFLFLSIPFLLVGCTDSEDDDTGASGGGLAAVPAKAASPGGTVGEVSVAQEEDVEAARRARVAKVLTDADGVAPLLNDFWTRELAALYGIRFDPPDFFGYYRGFEGSFCGVERLEANNASYCFPNQEEKVLFDIDWFQQYLEAHPKGATTFLILAHEWGHAVQDTWLENGGPDRWEEPNQELNADCLAGVFLSRSLEEGAIIEETGDEAAIFSWLFQSGSSDWTNPGTHGTRAQRLTAYRAGFERGTDYCRRVY